MKPAKVLTYRVVIKKDGSGFHGMVPLLPGCHTTGKTVEDTRINLREAITLHLQVMRDEGMDIPRESGLEMIESFDAATIFGKNNPLAYV
jgi:predicted RNase H-like HicB family nuclease